MNKEQRQKELKHLIDLLEEELAPHIQVNDKFELSRIPPNIRLLVEVITAKFPNFSNISATVISNFMVGYLVSQMRPRISADAYSEDSLGVNNYSILIEGSGLKLLSKSISNVFDENKQMIEYLTISYCLKSIKPSI